MITILMAKLEHQSLVLLKENTIEGKQKLVRGLAVVGEGGGEREGSSFCGTPAKK